MSKTKDELLNDVSNRLNALSKKITTQNRTIEIEKDSKPVKKEDGRKNNGGHHNGGRKPGGDSQLRRTLKSYVEEHFDQEVEVEVEDPLTHVMVKLKKPRVVVVLEKLYEISTKGSGDSHAAERWLSRGLGKPKQPVVGDEESDPIKVELGIERILEKAYGEDEDDEE